MAAGCDIITNMSLMVNMSHIKVLKTFNAGFTFVTGYLIVEDIQYYKQELLTRS
jgi:hypothetical protein